MRKVGSEFDFGDLLLPELLKQRASSNRRYALTLSAVAVVMAAAGIVVGVKEWWWSTVEVIPETPSKCRLPPGYGLQYSEH